MATPSASAAKATAQIRSVRSFMPILPTGRANARFGENVNHEIPSVRVSPLTLDEKTAFFQSALKSRIADLPPARRGNLTALCIVDVSRHLDFVSRTSAHT